MAGENPNSPLESMFLESCKTRTIPPQILKTFKKIKFVTKKSESKWVMCIRPDQYKNMMDVFTRKNMRRDQSKEICP
jgi:hypothetical protein